MTKIKIALVIAALILALAFTEYYVTVSVCDNILEKIGETEISAKADSDETKKLCGEIRSVWDSRKQYIEIFLPHSEADEIDITLEQMYRYSEIQNYNDVIIQCGILKNQMDSLKNSEGITLYNIF